MKAIKITEHNKPWEMVEMDVPKAGPGQVVIRVRASGICGTDLHIANGLLSLPLPLVLGHESVGEVVEVGPGVLDLALHDRVGVSWDQKGCGCCRYCIREQIKYCEGGPEWPKSWVHLGGGLAEYQVAYASGCTKLPKDLEFELAAPLFCAGFTVASGFNNARPKPGERIAVLGVGGLGHLAIQYAKAKGHSVLAITQTEDKAKIARELGADDVLVAQSNYTQKIQAQGGVDIILHTGNSSDLASKLLGALRPEGRLVVMGIDEKPIQALPFELLAKQIQIIGSKQNNRADLVDILELTAQKKVKPWVEVYPLEEVNTAVERIKTGKVRFRAVIKL